LFLTIFWKSAGAIRCENCDVAWRLSF